MGACKHDKGYFFISVASASIGGAHSVYALSPTHPWGLKRSLHAGNTVEVMVPAQDTVSGIICRNFYKITGVNKIAIIW